MDDSTENSTSLETKPKSKSSFIAYYALLGTWVSVCQWGLVMFFLQYGSQAEHALEEAKSMLVIALFLVNILVLIPGWLPLNYFLGKYFIRRVSKSAGQYNYTAAKAFFLSNNLLLVCSVLIGIGPPDLIFPYINIGFAVGTLAQAIELIRVGQEQNM